MFQTLAQLITRRPRRILVGALVAAILAGAFGGGVANKLAPYGANDPASESVRADNAYRAATGLQPSIDVLAIVRLRDGVHAADSRARVERVATQLRREPLVKRIDTFYETNNKQMVSKDGRLTFAQLAFTLASRPDFTLVMLVPDE